MTGRKTERMKRMKKTKKGMRVFWVDCLRGFSLCSMMLYHAVWDAVYLFGISVPWYEKRPGFLWQQSICQCFILLAGFSFSMGEHPVKRGAEVFLSGALITLFTKKFLPESAVFFGILTFLGSAMLLFAIPDRLLRMREKQNGLLKRNEAIMGFLLSLLCFSFFRESAQGVWGLPSFLHYELPAAWYQNTFTAYLGFPPLTFFSTDYFPVIPWIFLFGCGYFLFFVWAHFGKPGKRYRETDFCPLCFLGRHSLSVYLLHQPLIFLLFLIFRAFCL